jgi:hypothetical protein
LQVTLDGPVRDPEFGGDSVSGKTTAGNKYDDPQFGLCQPEPAASASAEPDHGREQFKQASTGEPHVDGELVDSVALGETTQGGHMLGGQIGGVPDRPSPGVVEEQSSEPSGDVEAVGKDRPCRFGDIDCVAGLLDKPAGAGLDGVQHALPVSGRSPIF